MNNQQLRLKKCDNGLLVLIERHPEVRSRYITGVKDYLKLIPGAKQYEDNQIYKVVYNIIGLNHKNKVIKQAFLMMYDDLYPGERAALVTEEEQQLVEA